MQIEHFLTRDELRNISDLAYMVKNSRQNVGVRMLDAANSVIKIVEVQNSIRCPVPELVGTYPAILFFKNEKERDEFAELVKEAKPTFITKPL